MKVKRKRFEVITNPKITKQISKVLLNLGVKTAFKSPEKFFYEQKRNKGHIISSAKAYSLIFRKQSKTNRK